MRWCMPANWKDVLHASRTLILQKRADQKKINNIHTYTINETECTANRKLVWMFTLFAQNLVFICERCRPFKRLNFKLKYT